MRSRSRCINRLFPFIGCSCRKVCLVLDSLGRFWCSTLFYRYFLAHRSVLFGCSSIIHCHFRFVKAVVRIGYLYFHLLVLACCRNGSHYFFGFHFIIRRCCRYLSYNLVCRGRFTIFLIQNSPGRFVNFSIASFKLKRSSHGRIQAIRTVCYQHHFRSFWNRICRNTHGEFTLYKISKRNLYCTIFFLRIAL